MRAFFFSEARGIACHCDRQLLLVDDLVDKLTDHGMFAGTDQIKVFALDLIHHRVHLCKAHNAGHHIAADHERRNAVCKSAIDHEISCICDNCAVQSCNIAHQIIESVPRYSVSRIQIDAIKAFHDIRMIWDLIIRNERIAKPLYFNVFTIIFTNRNRWVDHLRDDHHLFFEFCFYFFFAGRQLIDPGIVPGDFCFYFFCFIFKALPHELSDFLGNLVFICSECFHFRFDVSVFSIQSDHGINQRELLILILLPDIFFYSFCVLTNKFNVQHYFAPLLIIPYNLSSSSSVK